MGKNSAFGRSRRNDGISSGVRSVYGIDPGLMRSVLADAPPTPRVEHKKKRRGVQTGIHGPGAKFTEAEVQRMRQLHEWLGLGISEIAHRMDVADKTCVKNIIEYVNYTWVAEIGSPPEESGAPMVGEPGEQVNVAAQEHSPAGGEAISSHKSPAAATPKAGGQP